MVKPAPKNPQLFPEASVNIGINIAKGKLLILIPQSRRKRLDTKIPIPLTVAMINAQREEPSTIVESPAGADSMASSPPVVCASEIGQEKYPTPHQNNSKKRLH